MENQNNRQNNRKLKKPLNDYARYSAIAFQMLAVILAGVWGGNKLDKYFTFNTPVFTIILSLIAVFAAIYLVIKDFIIKK